MKRLISTVLAVVMLLSMFAISAFAEGEIEIINDPQDAEVEYVAPVTLTVEAEGENLQYQWYAWTVYGVWPLYDDEHGVEGADTASLTILSSDCRMNAIYFYCEVGNGVDFEDSDTAAVTVPHQPAGDYIYDASTHRVVCVCDTIMEAEGHTVVTGACVCGYDAANPVIQPPTILEDEIDYDHNVETGEDVELTVVAYGLELTYQWSWYNMDNDQFVPLTDNEHYVGTATDTLTVKNLQCNEDFRWYFCTVSNSEGSERTDGYSIYVNHKYDQLFADPFGHGDACVCGDNTGVYNHYDFDEDRICDECEYVFDAAAPKITSYSEDVAVENGHEPVTFKVVASGEGLTYQWFDWNGEALADDERYSGTNTATLTVTSVYDPESGLFDCADQCAY